MDTSPTSERTIKDILNKGHLANEGTVCCPNHIELCTKYTSELRTALYPGQTDG